MSSSKVFAPIRKLNNESNEEMLANEVMNTLTGAQVVQVIRMKLRDGKKIAVKLVTLFPFYKNIFY